MTLHKIDGDQLTLASIKGLGQLGPIFKVFDPRTMFVDRATGYMNRGMDLKRDYAAIHSAMWEIDRKLNDFLENRDGDSAGELADYGIDFLADSNTDIDENLKKTVNHMSKDWQEHFYDIWI